MASCRGTQWVGHLTARAGADDHLTGLQDLASRRGRVCRQGGGMEAVWGAADTLNE